MTYAVLDNGIIVGSTEDLGDGFHKIMIDGKEYRTSNIELWATEFGFTLEDADDIEINIYPVFPGYTI